MLTIYGKLAVKKNNKRILKNRKTGKPFVASSVNSKKADKKILPQLMDIKNEEIWKNMIKNSNIYKTTGKEKPLFVEFTIYRATKHRFDYCNQIQGLEDCLVKAGYLEDDSADYYKPSFGDYQIDKDNPRVELRIIN